MRPAHHHHASSRTQLHHGYHEGQGSCNWPSLHTSPDLFLYRPGHG